MKKTKIDMMLFSTALNIIGFIVMGLMPDEVNACVALYPTFVMMSVQWVVFGGLGGYNSSPIFSTNNLRQMSAAFAEYLCDRKSEHLDKAKYFAGSIFFFHLGAALGFVACKLFAVKAAYFGIIPCVLLSAMVVVPKLSYSKRTFRSNLLSALLTQTHL
jgi:uncharacterized membrane protein YoaK (UPF0700 family)